MTNDHKQTIALSFNQLERALILSNDVVSEALCEPITEEEEATLSLYRAALKKLAEEFFFMKSTRLP